MIHSFLLIGQSNMAGRGYIDEAESIDTRRIKILRNGRWLNMFRPINPDRSFSGVNLAESFAEKYAQVYNVDVGLICCADGGTALDQWTKGSLLYDNAVYQSKLAQRTSEIKGILWHQGEADCDVSLYTTYEKRFVKFMNDLRDDLGLYDVPFMLGGLGDFLVSCPLDEKLKNAPLLNEVLKTIAEKNPMIGFVSAEGLGSNPDSLHFDAKSLYKFGLRYFDEFEKYADRSVVEVSDTKESIKTMTEMELL